MTDISDAQSRVATELRDQTRASADGGDAHSLLKKLIEDEHSLQALRKSMEDMMRTTVAPWLTELARFFKTDNVVGTEKRVWALASVANACYGTFRDVFKDALEKLASTVGEEAVNELKLPKQEDRHDRTGEGREWRELDAADARAQSHRGRAG